MKKAVAVLVALALVPALAACTETKSEADSVEPASTTEVVETDRNAEIATAYAKLAPKGLAQVCGGMPLIGRPATERMAVKILGPQILGMGGEVTPVIDELLDKC